MELEELKQIWNSYDQQLSGHLTVNKKLLKQVSVVRIQNNLWSFKLENIAHLIISIFFLFIFSKYLMRSSADWKYFLPGLLIFILIVTELITSIYYLTTLSQIKPDAPITEVQKKINRILFFQKWETNLLYVLIPSIWPILIIVFSYNIGIDIYTICTISFWIWNIIGGVLVAIIVVWFINKYPDKGLLDAKSFLQHIKEFEKG